MIFLTHANIFIHSCILTAELKVQDWLTNACLVGLLHVWMAMWNCMWQFSGQINVLGCLLAWHCCLGMVVFMLYLEGSYGFLLKFIELQGVLQLTGSVQCQV